MAETLTMENQPEVTSIDNLSAEEQDSLKVGEQMEEAQEQLLAGKYKNAQELEKGYLELQKKLNTGEPEAQAAEPEAEPEEKGEAEPNILDTLWSQATSEDGKYEGETITALNKMTPVELAQMHLEYRNSVENQQPQNKDFSEADVTQLKGIVGGEENYSNMIDWAQKSLNKEEVDMFDQVMQRGDPLSAFFAVRALAFAYNDAVGYDGNVVQGKAPKQNTDQYRSQAEVLEAMSDPRYENDPAYRQDVMEKLQRSTDVNF